MKKKFKNCDIISKSATYLDDGIEIEGTLYSMNIFVPKDFDCGWHYQCLDIDTINNINTTKLTTIEKLNKISQLNDGWGGSNTYKFDNKIINDATKILSHVSISPTFIEPMSNGSLLITYSVNGSVMRINILTDYIDIIIDDNYVDNNSSIKVNVESAKTIIDKFLKG